MKAYSNMNKTIKQRDVALDYMKAFLVISMIFAHAIQILFNNKAPFFIKNIFSFSSLFINATAFPSFFFVFGYVYYLAYFKNIETSYSKILRNSVIILISYYISAIGIFIIKSKTIHFKSFVDILIFNSIIPYSEFLLSFAFLSFLCIPFGKIILQVSSNKKTLFIVSLLFLSLSFFMPYNRIGTQLGIFLGSNKFCSFPVLIYLPYFMFGIYLSKNKINFNKYVFIVVLAISAVCLAYILLFKVPDRFPPSFYWVGLSFLYTYVLYIFCRLIEKYNFGNFIKNMGCNTLFLLIISNLFFWALNKNTVIDFDWIGVMIAFLSILFLSNFLIKIIRNMKYM